MNRIGKGPNLTWIFIGIAFAITAITLSMTSFNTLLEDNGISISDNFDNIYGNISAEQAEINSIQSEASSKGNIYDVVKDIGGGALVVFVTGLSSIGAFFSMGKLASSILSTTQTAIPGLDALFGLLILVGVLYIMMRLITARRGVSNSA